MKWFLVWVTSSDMLGDGLIVLRVYLVDFGNRKVEFFYEKELHVAST